MHDAMQVESQRSCVGARGTVLKHAKIVWHEEFAHNGFRVLWHAGGEGGNTWREGGVARMAMSLRRKKKNKMAPLSHAGIGGTDKRIFARTYAGVVVRTDLPTQTRPQD